MMIPAVQLEIWCGAREANEQAMRRQPQLGAELRREKTMTSRNDKNSYNFYSQLKRNYL